MLPVKGRHGQGTLRATAQNLLAELTGITQLPVASPAQAGTSNVPEGGSSDTSGLTAPLGGSQVLQTEQLQQDTGTVQGQQQHVGQAATAETSNTSPSTAGTSNTVPSADAQNHQPVASTATQPTGYDSEAHPAAIQQIAEGSATSAVMSCQSDAMLGSVPSTVTCTATGFVQQHILQPSVLQQVTITTAGLQSPTAQPPTAAHAGTAAGTPPPQPPLTPAGLASATAGSASPSPLAAGGQSRQWTPLIDFVIDQLMQPPPQGPGAPSRDAAMGVLDVQSLMQLPNIYIYLNSLLRDKKVRTKLGSLKPRDCKHGISYLSISCPADILHADPMNPGGPDISCAEYLASMKHVLQHPELPCVDILDNTLVKEGHTGARRYKSFPLENCLIDLTDMLKPAGDSNWPWHELTDTQGDLHRARMPDWVAEGFKQPASQVHIAQAVPGAVAPGAEIGEEVTSPAHAQAAGQAPFDVPEQMASAVQHVAPVSEPAQPAPAVSAALLQAASGAKAGLPEAVQPDVLLAEVSLSAQLQAMGMPVAAAVAAPTLASPAQGDYKGTPIIAPVLGAAPAPAGAAVEQCSEAAAQARELQTEAPTGAVASAATATLPAAAHTAATQDLPAPTGSGAVLVGTSTLLDMLPEASASVTDHHSSTTSSSGDDAGSMQHSVAHASSSEGAASRSAVSELNVGFKTWVSQLYPTKAEARKITATLAAVQAVLHSRAKGQLWSVSALHPVGSFSRKTSLRGSHDLDLLVEINVMEGVRGHFQKCRDDCLTAICTVLCAPTDPGLPAAAAAVPGAAADPAATAARSGWLVDCHMSHWLRLFHPVLQLQLDVQVCQKVKAFTVGDGLLVDPRKQLLQHMIWQAEYLAGQAPDSPASLGGAAESLTCPSEPNRYRTALLTPLMTDIVANVPRQCSREYGFNPDRLVTDVIRAVKTWSKFGLTHAQKANSSSAQSGPLQVTTSSSAAAAAAGTQALLPAWVAPTSAASYDYTKQPPGYVWEIFVIFVLQRKLAATKAEGRSATEQYPSQTRTLQLFMDVLQAASQLLRPDSTEVIALYDLYTPEQCELFRELWGPVGPLCTPYIISPIDPSYNCTKHGLFKGWGVVAQAAGQLYEHMQGLLHGDRTAAAAPAAAAGDQPSSSGGGADDGEVQYMNTWEKLLSSSSLGPAVQAFDALTAEHSMDEGM